MSNDKYVGLDVHQASIVAAVLNAQGTCVMEAVLETKGSTIVDFIAGLSGRLHVTFEEGTQSAWLYDLINPLVAEFVVCNPRKNKLLVGENKGDRVDANKLAHRLRLGELKPVYKGEAGLRQLKALVHSYENLVGDTTRVRNRIKAIYRSRGVACAGRAVYGRSRRADYLGQLTEPGLRRRAELLYQQLDSLTPLRRAAQREMLAESRKQAAAEVLRRVPGIGPVRAAQILAVVMTPHRFRTKRQFWPYCGLAVVTHSTADYRFVGGKVAKRVKPAPTRGLNRNHNHRLKQVFKGAAIEALKREPLKAYYQGLVKKGIKPELARLSVARKLASITLSVWKKGEEFKAEEVTKVAA
jgi:transposase